VSSLPWWVQPSTDRPKTPLVNFSAVITATAVSFVVVAGVLAWIATHPGTGTRPTEPAPALVVLTPPSGAVAIPPAPPPAAPLMTIPAVHRPHREDVLINHIPQEDEAPPPLPPPAPEPKSVKAPPAADTPPAQPAGETYGTQVLFLNNPAVAKETAEREKKLLFVMHISGNFEDSCFT
jgi:hypothetical protein